MKRLEYIYVLLIAALFGWAISSCDDSGIITFDEEERAGSSYSGETVKTTFTIGLSAPDVSADIDAETRALDNANIDYAQPENGGRFKNIVVLLVDHQDRIYGIHCNEFDNASGMKEYNVVFSNIDVPAADVTNKEKYKVYAFGNVCTEHFTAIKNQEDAINENIRTTNINSRMNIYSTQIYTHCINATISHDDQKWGNIWNSYTSNISVEDMPQYGLNFTPGSNYIVNNNAVTSMGMPENNSVTATVVKGNTQFNVALKRVCARIKITFRNFTGQYLDASGNSVDNNIYIDEFKTSTNIFARSTKYLYDGNETYSAEAPFDILQMLNCKVNNVTASDHKKNKVENGKDITVSFYVFAVNLSGGCKYNLKVDRGKSLGTDTRTFQNGNVYVIWNMEKQRSIAYKNGKVTVSNVQSSKEKVPFQDQVFWQLELGSASGNSNTEGNSTYTLKHYPIDLETDMYDISKDNNRVVYFSKQSSGTFNSSPVIGPADNNSKQYVWFETANQAQYQINLCYSINDGQFSVRYYCLTVNNSSNLENTAKTWSWSHWYDWTIYAKYIIKPDQVLRDSEGTITKIERNNSYELEFSVMPNEDNKRELLVNCVRRQNEVDWSETQK